MIVASDPLAHAASTWSGRSAGPACVECRVFLSEGHRYYDEGEGAVVHYCCRAEREAQGAPAPVVSRSPGLEPEDPRRTEMRRLFGSRAPGEPRQEVLW